MGNGQARAPHIPSAASPRATTTRRFGVMVAHGRGKGPLVKGTHERDRGFERSELSISPMGSAEWAEAGEQAFVYEQHAPSP